MELKLYKFKANKDYQILVENKEEVLKIFNRIGDKIDKRTLKQIDIPMGRFECSDLNGNHYIFFDQELIVHYDDEDALNYPEDLVWNRDISNLVKSGEMLKKKEIISFIKNSKELKELANNEVIDFLIKHIGN